MLEAIQQSGSRRGAENASLFQTDFFTYLGCGLELAEMPRDGAGSFAVDCGGEGLQLIHTQAANVFEVGHGAAHSGQPSRRFEMNLPPLGGDPLGARVEFGEFRRVFAEELCGVFALLFG